MKSTMASEQREDWGRARLEAGIQSEDRDINQERDDGSLITIQVPPVFQALCWVLGLWVNQASKSLPSKILWSRERGKILRQYKYR